MRIVLDTNVLARAARGGSTAAKLLRLMIEPPHLIVLSPYLLSELNRVLRYDRMRAVHGLDDSGINDYIAHVQSASLLVSPAAAFPPMVVPHDPADDPVVATAVAGGADILCTRDHHLHHEDVQRYCVKSTASGSWTTSCCCRCSEVMRDDRGSSAPMSDVDAASCPAVHPPAHRASFCPVALTFLPQFRSILVLSNLRRCPP